MKGHHGVLFTPSFGSLSALGDSATGNEVDDEQDIQRRTLYSKLEFYAENENDVNWYMPT